VKEIDMHRFVEPRVRRLVAETLGVGAEELAPDVSLTDDLAADSLDLAELAVRLENEFGVTVGDDILEGLRTYGDVVRTTMILTSEHRETAVRRVEHLLPFWARLLSPRARPGAELLRTDFLTPYAAATLAEDALRAGQGARLELSLPSDAPDMDLKRVRDQFAWLGEHGVDVEVARHAPSARPSRSRAA
jgi:acyl carrier protein